MVGPNIAAIIVMAVVYMAIGWLWYSPKLFGDMIVCPTTKNGEECKSCCWMSYAGEFILALIIGYALSEFVINTNSVTAGEGVKVGFLAWLGFIATSMFSKVLWSKRPMSNFFICSGFYLLMLVIMGAVFAVWR